MSMAHLIIDEAFLQQIEALQSLTRHNVAGMFGGTHKARTYGSSCEFAAHREYTDGDDTARIDWNAYSRFDKLYLKLYLDERQMHTRIYIDASRSMEYGDAKKAEQALRLAAFLAYVSICETDKVSISVIHEDRVEDLIVGMVGKEGYLSAIGRLNDVRFEGDSAISRALLPASVGYGDGLSILISDFLTDNDYETAIDHLCEKKRDVFCIQVLSREELNPQVRGRVHFFDSENAEKTYRKNIDRDIIRAYKQALSYVTDRIQGYCQAREAGYLLATAEDSLGQIFFEKLPGMGVIK